MAVTIKLRAAAVRRWLDALSAKSIDEVAEVAAAVLESQTRARFAREVSPQGDQWAPWSEEYAARRPSKGGILDLSGALVDAIFARPTGRDSVEVGSGVEYAAAHQEGTEDIPARPFLGLGPADEVELVRAVEEHLERMAGRAA